MTALAISTDIPSAINTVEKLHAWSALLLSNVNPQVIVVEGVGYTERAAQAGVFYVAADNKHRILTRHSIQMSPDYMNGNAKIWQYAMELSTIAIPASFKAN
ncbi:MAG: glucose-6-phosphate dehydrogenase [Leptolyngbyaceae cyanobacterium SL_5_14]|nr:glucose-6-phosphate dehydrogenase [Leptolyngbyaceae cyanobacterium SL_5_14]